MGKSFTILIAAVILASGMHISVDRHYCGGTLADVKLSVTGKLASCGMEQDVPDCGNHPAFGQKCCEDQISFFNINNNFCPEYFKIIPPVTCRDLFFPGEESFISISSNNSGSDNWVLPPGDNLRSGLTQPEICIFLI